MWTIVIQWIYTIQEKAGNFQVSQVFSEFFDCLISVEFISTANCLDLNNIAPTDIWEIHLIAKSAKFSRRKNLSD